MADMQTAQPWYDCILLEDREFTEHELAQLKRVNLMCRNIKRGSVIGSHDTVLSRPISVQCTHYHPVQAVLALFAQHVDRTLKGDYPARHVERA